MAKVTVMLYWKYCLSAQQFMNIKTRTAEFVALNNVLRWTDKLQPIFENYLAHNVGWMLMAQVNQYEMKEK